MTLISNYWNQLGIKRKFSFSFSLLLSLMILISVTASLSFLSIRNAEDDIRESTAIRVQVLKMDRDMERAQRLLSDFFLNHRSIGLQQAHEQYVQPAVRQIAKVISQSRSLEKNLFHSNLGSLSRINPTDVNLYLAAAKRFADTSIEAVELLSKRVAPDSGIEFQLSGIEKTIGKELQDFQHLENVHKKMCSFVMSYQIRRQRHLMQEALNSLDTLHEAVEQETILKKEQKNRIISLIHSCRTLCFELLDVDLKISEKFQDFILQKQIVSPVSEALIGATEEDGQLIQQQIDKVYRLTGFIILSITLIIILTMSCIARLLSNTVIGNILQLKESVREFGKGNMDIRASENSRDELGQLARGFNGMASQVKTLVENLEQTVEQRTAELSQSEERFRHLVNDLPKIGVQGYDRERKVIYWNKASEILYGYSEEEAMGKKLEDLIIPEPMKKNVLQAIQNWYENDVAIPSSELILHHKDGGDVPIYCSHVMNVSSQGEKIMYCVDLDLTDLKLAQAREQKSELLYRALFDHSTSGVAVYEAIDNGQDFIIKDFNKAGEEIEGVRRKSILGRKLSEVFPGAKEFGLLSVFRTVWETGEPALHPVSYYKDDKLQGWRENRVYRLPTGEIIAVYNDLTKEKQLEEENKSVELRLQRARKMEAIGLMAGGVAHDLNNILTGITGYPELLLLQLPETSKLREPIEAIRESGKRAAAVVADLLTVARGVAISKVTANMNTLVAEYLASPEYHQLHSISRHVQCHTQLAKDLPNLLCSPVHITKCIMNLVVNAMEAIDKAGRITISTTTVIPGASWARENGLKQMEYIILTVADTGTGISAENIDHIFEPFYTKKVMGRSGTGLGLAVVWNTMEDHAGKIFVESSEKGTRFQLYFPVSSRGGVVQSECDTEEEYIGHNEHILVVDDEPALRDVACQMLENLGYTVDSVSSGELAVEFLKDNQVDLLMLDMLMDPGMNGAQTYEKILSFSPDQKAIVVSGFSESDDVRATLNLGACAFLKKPYSMKELSYKVQEALTS
ncbi:MAG: response regulator [Desulfocapsa sp.]|nr:response regulator [Desulfocapsa sp.]